MNLRTGAGADGAKPSDHKGEGQGSWLQGQRILGNNKREIGDSYIAGMQGGHREGR